MKYFFDNLKNNFDFFLRNHILFSRRNYTEIGVDIWGNNGINTDNLFENEKQKFLYYQLQERYDLAPLHKLNKVNFLTNLYYLNIFEKHLQPDKQSLNVLDIGSKNWNYAASEYIFFHFFSNELKLNGIEIDPYRLCTNLFSRLEISKFYTKNLNSTNYIAGDFMEHNEKYDYIIWILPFITEYPHIRWGLPLKYFKPEEMLRHAYSLLNDRGEILIINQGENEYNIQKELILKLNLNYEFLGKTEDEFNLYKNPRFCSKVIKQ